ncbi:taurine catabolism dioxygenase [Xylariaceae sp. FL0255]|nr:taurine catabolism dioxygenase [Xylariaceae sp. FL0255]
MAPSQILKTHDDSRGPSTVKVDTSQRKSYKPLEFKGLWDGKKMSEITPTMGLTCEDVDLAQVLRSPDCDAKLRDLAILVSRRGLCVIPGQANLTIQDQKLLCRKLGMLTTRPSASDLWIHPVNQTILPDGTLDGEYMFPSRDPSKKLYTQEGGYSKTTAKNQSRADGWHTDGSFENVPVDYTVMHMKECPDTGGDTLFASAYEAYDLLSQPMQQMLEGLDATFMPPHHSPERVANRLWPASRGAPQNVGAELRASHPCVRTNPVTGWKSLYAFGHHLERIEGLGDVENRMMMEFMTRLVTENHQLQTRVRWRKDDLAIWDNRAVYHCATYDYGDGGHRRAIRVCGCGEVPYLDSKSTGRREALGI